MMQVTIDAGPILAGGGGISNYVNPLLQHVCARKPADLRCVLHWRVRDRDRLCRARQLIATGLPEYPGVEHHLSRWPDRLLRWCWGRRLRVLAELSLPPTDVFFATTEMMPFHARCRRLTIVHDITPAMIPEYFREPRDLYLARVKRLCDACAAIVCVSRTTAANLCRECDVPEAKVAVVYPGIPKPLPVEGGDEGVLQRYGIRPPFLIYLGALAPNKNVEGVLRAFAGFRRAGGSDWQLVLVGKDFVGADHWRAILSEEGLGSEVVFTGWMTTERWALLRRASLLLHLSWYEGFPVPVMEALSLGLPALVSDRGPFPEALPNPDQCVDPADLPAVVAKLRAFAESAEVGRRWAQFMQRRARDFDWGTSAETLISVLERLR